MGSTPNKMGSGWKPMDNMAKSGPAPNHSQNKPEGSNSTFPRPKGRLPKLLSNGQTAMIHKHNGYSQNNNPKANVEQTQTLPQKRFNTIPMDDTSPKVKKQSLQATLPLKSTSTTMDTSNLNFQSASRDAGASHQMTEKNITQNSNKDNSITIEDEVDDSVSTDKTSIIKESPKNPRKLKKKIAKLEAKLHGYKQNESVFRKNTGIITEEIYDNQFKIAKIYGQLAILKEKNENLNNFQDYLINDIVTTKLNYEHLKQNSRISSAEKKVQNHRTIKSDEDNDVAAIEDAESSAANISQNDKTEASTGTILSGATTTTLSASSEPTSKSTSTIPAIPGEAISTNKSSPDTTISESVKSNENEDNIVTKTTLFKLEKGVLNRITEFEELERSLHNEIKHAEESSQIKDVSTTIESSYVKRLRNIIVTNNKDLRSLHTILNNRTANFQLLLNKVEQEYTTLKQKVFNEESGMKDYIFKSQQYMSKANSQITSLQKEKEAAKQLLNDFQNKLQQQNARYSQDIALLKSKNEAALANMAKNNNNNNNNNNNTNQAMFEEELRKKDAELKSSRNLYLSQQHTIELLSQELYNAKTELASNAKKNTPNDAEVVEKATKILAQERAKYKNDIQVLTMQYKQELMALKKSNNILLDQIAKETAQKKVVIDPTSPEIKFLLREERKRFLNDIKTCLDIISNKSSLRDTINIQDISNAKNLLSMVSIKLIEAAENSNVEQVQKLNPMMQNSMSPNPSLASIQNASAQNSPPLHNNPIQRAANIALAGNFKTAPTATPHGHQGGALPRKLPFSHMETIESGNSNSNSMTSRTDPTSTAPVVHSIPTSSITSPTDPRSTTPVVHRVPANSITSPTDPKSTTPVVHRVSTDPNSASPVVHHTPINSNSTTPVVQHIPTSSISVFPVVHHMGKVAAVPKTTNPSRASISSILTTTSANEPNMEGNITTATSEANIEVQTITTTVASEASGEAKDVTKTSEATVEVQTITNNTPVTATKPDQQEEKKQEEDKVEKDKTSSSNSPHVSGPPASIQAHAP